MPNTTKVKSRLRKETIVKVPLSALRCLFRYPKEKKVICEIDIRALKKLNKSQNLDEIINEARIDYALGNYKTFSKAKDLIAELRA